MKTDFDLLLESIPPEWIAKYGEIIITDEMTPEDIKNLIIDINSVKNRVGMYNACRTIGIQRKLFGADKVSPKIDTSDVYFTDNRVFNKLFGEYQKK